MKPLGSYCIIDIPKSDIELKSRVVASEAQAYNTPVTGTVVNAGPKSKFIPGDVLYFRRYSVDELRLVTADLGENSIFLVEDADAVAVKWLDCGTIKRWYIRLLAKFK